MADGAQRPGGSPEPARGRPRSGPDEAGGYEGFPPEQDTMVNYGRPAGGRGNGSGRPDGSAPPYDGSRPGPPPGPGYEPNGYERNGYGREPGGPGGPGPHESPTLLPGQVGGRPRGYDGPPGYDGGKDPSLHDAGTIDPNDPPHYGGPGDPRYGGRQPPPGYRKAGPQPPPGSPPPGSPPPGSPSPGGRPSGPQPGARQSGPQPPPGFPPRPAPGRRPGDEGFDPDAFYNQTFDPLPFGQRAAAARQEPPVGYDPRGRTPNPRDGRGPRDVVGAGPGAAGGSRYGDDDDFDEDDDYAPRRRKEGRRGPLGVARWLLIAVVAVLGALAFGIVLAFGWQKIHPSDVVSSDGGTGTVASTAPSAPASAGASATPSATATAAPGTKATVPAGWVAVTDAQQAATFSHPGAWKQRRDNTGVFFAEPGTGASGFGPQMVGVARVRQTDARTALNTVQQSEFANQPGYRQVRLGNTTGGDGTSALEFEATYTREGQPVEYILRAVPGQGVTYVLIARSTATPAGGVDTLMRALTASFKAA